MRRILWILIALMLILSSCSAANPQPTREEIAYAYSHAGYSVWTDAYDEPLDHGQIAYLQANHPDGDYIYFSFFETEEAAKAYKEEYYHPMAMGLFSVIFGDPSWQKWIVNGNIVIEYDEPAFYEVFQDLLNGK